jgi:hypothetical protein
MQKFIDTITAMANGALVPLSNATVTVYAAGTTNLATLYATNSTGAPLPNPLTSSATGLVSFYAADGRYDIRVAKSGFATVTVADVLLEDPADGIIHVISGATVTASTVDSTPIGATAASTGRFTAVQLASGATGTIALGEMRLNATENTIDVGMGGGVTGQMFEGQYVTVKNGTGSTITQGMVVSFTGASAGVPECGKAMADAAANPMYIIGVLTQDITAGASGRTTTFGKVRAIDTTGAASGETWASGDILYVSPTTPGLLTNVEPTAPNVAVSVAAVLTVHASTGVLLVRPLLHARTHYGVFSSTVDQTAAVINTAYAVEFTDADASSGVALDVTDGSLVVCSRAGLYNFQFSAQLVKSNSSIGYAWIWPRINGTDVANSATKVSIQGSSSEIAPAWNFVLPMTAGDEFQLMYAMSATSISLEALPATAFCPATPSVILSVTQVNQ